MKPSPAWHSLFWLRSRVACGSEFNRKNRDASTNAWEKPIRYVSDDNQASVGVIEFIENGVVAAVNAQAPGRIFDWDQDPSLKRVWVDGTYQGKVVDDVESETGIIIKPDGLIFTRRASFREVGKLDLNIGPGKCNEAAHQLGLEGLFMYIRTRRLAKLVLWVAVGWVVPACDNDVRFGGVNGLPGGAGGASGEGGGGGSAGGAGGSAGSGAGGGGGGAGQGGSGGCVDGTVQPCYSGNPTTMGVGQCLAGAETCAAGQWSTCVGEVLPGPETCNGLDDDCDGQIDNGNPGGGTDCSTGNPGICAPGTMTCTNGVVVCVPNAQPAAEVCDGLDNDCNGTSDEGNPGGGNDCSVANQFGPCGRSKLVCLSGTIACPQTVFPTTEQCNDLDDDCDGQFDNGDPGGGASCAVSGQLGECANGITTCSAGAISCTQSIMPTSEVCNDGKDNDCDGTVDNGCPSSSFPCNINGAALPLPIALPAGARYGTMTFDGDCNLITAGGSTGQVFRIDKTTGVVSTLVPTAFTGDIYGVMYRKDDNLIYVATQQGELYSIPMVGGAPTHVMDLIWMGVPMKMMELVATPSAYPQNGQLLGSTIEGHIFGIDMKFKTLNYFTYISATPITDMEVSPDGNFIYATQPASNVIHRLQGNAWWLMNIQYVTSIAMATDGTRLWATYTNFMRTEHKIAEIALPSGTMKLVSTTIPFLVNYWDPPVGIVADADDEVFIKSWDGTNARIVKLP